MTFVKICRQRNAEPTGWDCIQRPLDNGEREGKVLQSPPEWERCGRSSHALVIVLTAVAVQINVEVTFRLF